MPPFIALMIVALACTAVMTAPAGGQTVGRLSASAGTVLAESNGLANVLAGGAPVSVGMRLQTGAGEQIRLVLSDGSLLAIGASSSIVIEALGSDPATGRPVLQVAVERGTVRFNGDASSPRATLLSLSVPGGRLDIGAGMAVVEVGADATRGLLLTGGSMTARGDGGSQQATAGDSMGVLARDGAPPPPPQPVGSRDAARMLGNLEVTRASGGPAAGPAPAPAMQAQGPVGAGTGGGAGGNDGAGGSGAGGSGAGGNGGGGDPGGGGSTLTISRFPTTPPATLPAEGEAPPGARNSRDLVVRAGAIARMFFNGTPAGAAGITAGNESALSTDATAGRVVARLEISNRFDPERSAVLPMAGTAADFVDDARTRASGSGATPGAGYGTGGRLDGDWRMATIAKDRIGSNFAPTFSLCDCPDVAWGRWVGELRYGAGMREDDRDQVDGFWAGGRRPSAAEMPTSGTAVFGGTAVGTVHVNDRIYEASGTVTHSWNFATRRGVFDLQNFDGASYRAPTAGGADVRTFSGALVPTEPSGIVPLRRGTVDGAFVRSGGDPAGAQVGNFTVFGNYYSAGGAFAAGRK